MSQEISESFHDKLSADALMAILGEAQETVRSYDIKAQIVGVGYIFALGIVLRSGNHIPIPQEFAMWYVFAGWVIVILPIIMFAMVLYPSRVDKIEMKRGPTKVDGMMYFNDQRYRDMEAYLEKINSADWAREVVFEIVKVSDIRDVKRVRFLRALYWTGGSFFMLFMSQMLRAGGVVTQ